MAEINENTSLLPLKDKNIIVTGANTGIGKEVALALASGGANVILACRSEERANDAIASIREQISQLVQEFEPSIEFVPLDLSDLRSVKQFSDLYNAKYTSLDVLITNAGVTLTKHTPTAQGLEGTFGTNHMGHFYLIHLLLDLLIETPNSRLVIVGSDAHKYGYDFAKINAPPSNGHNFGSWEAFKVYGLSKACNMMVGLYLSKLLLEKGLQNPTVNSVHPGAVKTELSRNSPSWMTYIIKPIQALFFSTPAQGASPIIHLATDQGPEVLGVTGKYYNKDKTVKEPGEIVTNEENQKRLWDYSVEFIRKHMGENALDNILLSGYIPSEHGLGNN